MTLKAGAIRFNTDLNQLEIYEGFQWTGMSATSPDLHTGGTRGLGAGGEPFTTQIQYWNISTATNALDFGNLTANRQYIGNGQASSRSRGLFMGGRDPSNNYLNTIEYVTISTTGETAIDFGDLSDGGHYAIVGSNSTRAIALGRYDGSAVVNVIDHVTIAHTGDAKDFGDSITAISDGAGAASPTRMLAFAGNSPSKVNTIQFVTISTLGNSADFGDLVAVRSQICGSSNAVRACTYGGHDGSSRTDHIEFVTITTLGDSKDFGNLSSTRRIANATSSSTRGLISGGYEDPAAKDTMEYIEFASTGDAVDFANLATARYAMTGAASNGHGGLG